MIGGTFVTYFGFINTSMIISFAIVGFSLIYLLFGNVIIKKNNTIK